MPLNSQLVKKMATDVDGPTDLVELFQAQWNASNTNNITPTIARMIDTPKQILYEDETDVYVLIYSFNGNEELPTANHLERANVFEDLTIDLRFKALADSETKDELFRKCRAEIKRIVYSNRKNPTTNWDELDPSNKRNQDLSSRNELFYRQIRDVTLINFNRDQTT